MRDCHQLKNWTCYFSWTSGIKSFFLNSFEASRIAQLSNQQRTYRSGKFSDLSGGVGDRLVANQMVQYLKNRLRHPHRHQHLVKNDKRLLLFFAKDSFLLTATSHLI